MQAMGCFSNCSWDRARRSQGDRPDPAIEKHSRGLRSRQAGSAHPDAFNHPKSGTRGLPRRQPAIEKHSRGLRSRQADSAHPDANNHPKSGTRGLPRRQPAEAKHTRGLRSWQADSAHPDERSKTPKRRKEKQHNQNLEFRPGLLLKPAQNSGARYGEQRHQNKA